jgi:alanine dehydrogenase
MEDPNLRRGLNVCKGKITYRSVAEALNLEYVETPQELAA